MKKNTTAPTSRKQDKATAEVLKIGIDVHKKKHVFVCQYDGQSPKAPQKMDPDEFLAWIEKQANLVGSIHTCYEAGCFGFVLHRKLEALGVKSLVIRPRDWDEYGSKVKTDGRDARELCGCLDRYLAGNERALTVVRAPSLEQERERALSRQRDTLAKERKRLQNVGTSAALYHGVDLQPDWWKPKVFETLKKTLPDFLLAILAPYQAVLETLHRQLREATGREERKAARPLPVGLGALTASVLDQEFVDYSRFSNRGEVSSFTGLCPSEHSSGGKRAQGSISKSGNPRIRHMLIEAVWRMFAFQPDYKPILKWKERMRDCVPTAARKKKMAVAIAREFAVDWWRIQTGAIKPEDVGLKVANPTSYAAKAALEGRVSKIYA